MVWEQWRTQEFWVIEVKKICRAPWGLYGCNLWPPPWSHMCIGLWELLPKLSNNHQRRQKSNLNDSNWNVHRWSNVLFRLHWVRTFEHCWKTWDAVGPFYIFMQKCHTLCLRSLRHYPVNNSQFNLQEDRLRIFIFHLHHRPLVWSIKHVELP